VTVVAVPGFVQFRSPRDILLTVPLQRQRTTNAVIRKPGSPVLVPPRLNVNLKQT